MLDTEAEIGILIEGPLMRGVDVGELVGGKQGREIFSGVAASSPPPCGEGQGWGSGGNAKTSTPSLDLPTPHPTLPHKGGGL